jgi:D-sedoheptulose 7-phosphate isomerase
VVEAARRGREVGATVWALTGPAPNALADVADEACVVDCAYPATVQELHLVAVHLMCAAVDRTLEVPGTTR